MTQTETKTKKAKKGSASASNAGDKKNFGLLDVIKYPIVTEKSTNASAHNQVTFAVQVILWNISEVVLLFFRLSFESTSLMEVSRSQDNVVAVIREILTLEWIPMFDMQLSLKR